MCAAFIITTGLMTAVTERQRELAILRCIGALRGQLARTQLVIGLVIGALGALVGVPLGVGIALLLAWVFRTELPAGPVIPPGALALGVIGSLSAGIAGAAWPAWRTSRVSPLEGLAARATTPRRIGIVITLALGLGCLLYQAVVVGLPQNGQVIFWLYATSGLPLMFIGYFLLSVPATLLASRLLAGPLSALLRLPRHVLGRTIAATPYRHGFTAGALMGGLALMVAIWTNGGAILRDWLDRIQFPDAFVSGLNLTEGHQRQIAAMSDVVKDTCAISLYPVETDIFGVHALQQYKTTFVAFEPESFMRMTNLTWVQGDPQTAVRRLKEGGAVIVAREFLIAQGLGVGHRFTCRACGQTREFEIVGVVASPGLEIVSKFFNVGEDYTDQAVHAVFGSREDLKNAFFGGQPAPIQLIQIQFTDRVAPGADGAVLNRIRNELLGAGILDVGSGRQIRDQIRFFATGLLLVFSVIAFTGMLVSCFGVASLIAASIEARRFEFGILRAVGAQRGLLARLVLAETLIVALAAAVIGTLMGLQGSWAGQRLYALLLGLDLHLRPPARPIAVAWLIVATLALAAAAPAVWRLNRRRPRELLGAMKG
jgi:putative ABC transport system permease protein